MRNYKATIKSEMASNSALSEQVTEKLGHVESHVLESATNLSEKLQDLTSRLDNTQKTLESNIAGVQSEITVSNTFAQEGRNSLRLEVENLKKSTEQQNENISKRLNELSERPATLSAKERLMLNTLGTIPKRLNDLENTIFESDKSEIQASGAAQTQTSQERLDDLDERINPLKVDLDLVKTEVAGRVNVTKGILDGFWAELKNKTTEWEAALKQQKMDYQSSIHSMNALLVKTTNEVRGAEHSLRSLTARYNQLTTEKLVRQIAEVVHPLPMQLKTDQAMLKEQVSTIHAKMGDLSEAVAASAARQSDDKSEQLNEISEELKTLNEDFKRLEAESKKLEVKFGSGRDSLQKEQDEHTKRLNRLEGRVVHKDDWPSGDEDDEEERVQREGSNLLREFQSHNGPSNARFLSATAASKSSIASPTRASPVMKASEASQDVFGRTSPLRTTTNPPELSKSLASRIEPPQSVASRIEPAPKATSPESAGTKRSLPSDSEELDGEDTVVAQRAPLGAPGNPRKKGSRQRVKKAARTSSFK